MEKIHKNLLQSFRHRRNLRPVQNKTKKKKPAASPVWPRIRDLPEAERVPFAKWLEHQTRPMIEGSDADEVRDGYYSWDYEKWKQLKGRRESVATWD